MSVAAHPHMPAVSESAGRAWARWLSEIVVTRLQPRFDAAGSSLFRVVDASGTSASVRGKLCELEAQGESLWVVTTFDRADGCAGVIDELRRAALSLDEKPFVVVVRDACGSDYGEVRSALQSGFGERGLFIETARHLGKREFWRTHQLIFDLVQALAPRSVLSLQDDIELVPGWLEEARSIIHAIDDPRLGALSLFTTPDDAAGGRWISFERRATPCGRARLTQWMDLPGFLATPRLFDVLDHRMRPILGLRWALDPTKSSGVGRQITRRLFAHDVHLYQVSRSLLLHGSEPSRMNPEARARRPMDNREGT